MQDTNEKALEDNLVDTSDVVGDEVPADTSEYGTVEEIPHSEEALGEPEARFAFKKREKKKDRRVKENAVAQRAEMIYGYEYRKRLIEENERQLEKERREAEDKERAVIEEENRRRAEEIYNSHRHERESILKRGEASDKLINSALKRMEAEKSEDENVEYAFEDYSERIPENIVVDPGQGALINADNILYIPPHNLTIPVPTYIGTIYHGSKNNSADNQIKKDEKPAQRAPERPVRYEIVDAFALALAEKDTHKRIQKIDKEIAALRKKEITAQPITRRLLYNRCLAYEKDAVDFLIFLLLAAVRLSESAKIKKLKNILSARIARYNTVVSEFISRTGRDVPRLSALIVEDIVGGRSYDGPVLLAVDEDIDGELGEPYSISKNALHKIEKEAVRRAIGTEAEIEHLQRELSKNEAATDALTEEEKASFTERMCKITEQIVRDEDTVSERYKYLDLKCSAMMSLNTYSFSTRKTSKFDNVRHLKWLSRFIKRNKKAAIKFEKLDNDRYYEIISLDTDKVICPRVRADRSELEMIRTEMKDLLDKRDRINERLYKIYLGRDARGKTSFEKKVTKARRRAMKVAYNDQLKLYKTVEKERLPLEMKERVYKLMNERTNLHGYLAELKLRARNATETEKKELKRERRRVQKDIKCLSSDIGYYFRKKITRRIEKNKTRLSQLGWLLLLIIVVVTFYIAYRLFGDTLIEFIKSYISGLFGGLI